MSMISELIEELIDNADLYTKELHDLMYRAADTIEMLSEKAREPKQGEWQDGFNAGWTAKEADRLGDCDGCKFDNPKVVARCEGCCRNYADGYVAEQTDCPWG